MHDFYIWRRTLNALGSTHELGFTNRLKETTKQTATKWEPQTHYRKQDSCSKSDRREIKLKSMENFINNNN